ncbi:MAG: VOC family protein [Maricaulaceae bacterium]|jgi:catechol 2,3-dioxygenase-like lactoylglutathione lyase family enzyme
MLDHIGIKVSDYPRAKAFYDKALAPLGFVTIMEFEHEGVQYAGLGKAPGTGEPAAGQPTFWFNGADQTSAPLHVAFPAKTRADVDAFYEAAMAAGGTDNGPPGLRPHYHEHYYGAFVLDPDGHNIEAVCHTPE